MFSYYGSKKSIVNYYPPPKHNKIIEPFAGSARYSLKYWQNDVLLVDKYEVIIDVWKYLQQASEKDILRLPNSEMFDNLKDTKLTKEEKYLIGFCIAPANQRPCHKKGAFDDWNRVKKIISNNLFKIKHWKIILIELSLRYGRLGIIIRLGMGNSKRKEKD